MLPAPKSTSSVKVVHVKKGRRLYGGIHTNVSSGRRCYLAHRRLAEIFRGGEKNISDAIRLGKASWALDHETLLEMRAKGIGIVGVFVRDNGDIYLTHISNYFDRTKASILNCESRGGAVQSYLPLQYFKHQVVPMKIKRR